MHQQNDIQNLQDTIKFLVDKVAVLVDKVDELQNVINNNATLVNADITKITEQILKSIFQPEEIIIPLTKEQKLKKDVQAIRTKFRADLIKKYGKLNNSISPN